jgi:large subunit ribosomal protein L20
MSRIKRGVTTRAKHKRILDQAKGYRGRRKNTIRVARQAVEKAGQYAYRDRKVMADLAMNEGGAFTAIIAQAKQALPSA